MSDIRIFACRCIHVLFWYKIWHNGKKSWNRYMNWWMYVYLCSLLTSKYILRFFYIFILLSLLVSVSYEFTKSVSTLWLTAYHTLQYNLTDTTTVCLKPPKVGVGTLLLDDYVVYMYYECVLLFSPNTVISELWFKFIYMCSPLFWKCCNIERWS